MSQEENPIESTSKWVKCPVCQQIIKAKGKYAHFKTAHPELNYHEYKDKFEPAHAPEGREPSREAPLYKGELDTTTILREILKKHPDIPPKVVEEVCSWAEYGPIHPTQLVYLLSSMRGISTTTANIVAQKYSLALQKASTEGKMQLPSMLYAPMQQQQPTPFGYPMPLYQQQTQLPMQTTPTRFQAPTPHQQTYPTQQPLWPQQTQPWPQQQYISPPVSPERYVEDRIRTLEDRLTKLIDERLKPKEEKPETYVDVELEEPVKDKEGNYIVDDSGKAITRKRKMKVPASQAALYAKPEEDTELKVLEKIEMYKKVFGEKGLDESKIRDIIRQEVPKVPEKPTPEIKPEDVQKAAAEAASSAVEKFMNIKEKESVEERRHRELLAAIQSGVSAKTVEGYKQDSYRLFGQGLSESASAARDLLKDRRPIEVVVREGLPIFLGAPPPKKVEEGAEEGLLKKLENKGWVVEK